MMTLAPTITWSHDGVDSGELVTAALTGGVPHPPGYPTYMLLAGPFSRLIAQEPARGVNLLSALSAALAASLATITTYRLTCGLRADSNLGTHIARTAISAAAGLLLAFSTTLWSQALIAEVYALHAVFAAAVLLLVISLFREAAPVHRRMALWAAAFLLGLGAGNHLSLILMTPALVLATVWCVWPTDRRTSTWLGACGFLLIGLSIYLILPLRAQSGSPINWGDPRTLDRFFWLVSGRLYQRYLFALPLEVIPERVAAWAAILRQEFGLWGVGLGLVGIWHLFTENRRRFILMLLIYFPCVIYALGYDTTDSYVYLVLSDIIFAVWIGCGMWRLWLEWQRATTRWSAWVGILPALLSLVLVLLPLLSHWDTMDLSDDWEAWEYAEQSLDGAAPAALVLTHGDRSTFALWYAHFGRSMRPDLAVINISLWNYSWYRHTMRQLNPAVAGAERAEGTPETLDDLIAFNRGHRAVYLAGGQSMLDSHYSWQVEGNLRILAETE
jgi:hypothetical protein